MRKISIKNILAGIGGALILLSALIIGILSRADYYDFADIPNLDTYQDNSENLSIDLGNTPDNSEGFDLNTSTEGADVFSTVAKECVPKVPNTFFYKGYIPYDEDSQWFSKNRIINGDGISFSIKQSNVYIAFPSGNKQTISLKKPVGLAYDTTNKYLWITDIGDSKIIYYSAPCIKKNLTVVKDVVSFDMTNGLFDSRIEDKFIFNFKLNDFSFNLSDGGTAPQKKVFTIDNSRDYVLTEIYNEFLNTNQTHLASSFFNFQSNQKFGLSHIMCRDTKGKEIVRTYNYQNDPTNIVTIKAENVTDDITCSLQNVSYCAWIFAGSISFPKNDRETAPILYGHTGFAIGGFGFAGIGFDQSKGEFSNRWFKFIPSNTYGTGDAGGRWVEAKPFPGELRKDALGFSLGGKGYVMFGENKNKDKLYDVWEYSPDSDSWERKNDFPFKGKGRSNASAFIINEQAYVLSGQGGGGQSFNDVYSYDAGSDSWDQIASFPGKARQLAVAFNIGNKVYFGTGKDASGKDLADFWEYYQGKWTQKTDFPGGPTSGAYGFSLNDFGYVGGGSGRGTGLDGFWQFNPNGNSGNGSWEKIQESSEDRMPGLKGVTFVIGERAYFSFVRDGINKVYSYRNCP